MIPQTVDAAILNKFAAACLQFDVCNAAGGTTHPSRIGSLFGMIGAHLCKGLVQLRRVSLH
jgi:hypothetical protein